MTRITVLAMFLAVAAKAQEAEAPLLANKFGELCTMCEAALRCESAAAGDATVYVFHKKGFVGQMLTVLDYVPFIGPPLWEERPATVIAPGANTTRIAVNARLSFKEKVIEVAGATIDRTTGVWRKDGAAAGTCRAIDKSEVAALSSGATK